MAKYLLIYNEPYESEGDFISYMHVIKYRRKEIVFGKDEKSEKKNDALAVEETKKLTGGIFKIHLPNGVTQKGKSKPIKLLKIIKTWD